MFNRLILIFCSFLFTLCVATDDQGFNTPVAYNIECSSSDNIIIDNIEREVCQPAPQYQTLEQSHPYSKKQRKYKVRIWTKTLVFDVGPQAPEFQCYLLEDEKHYSQYGFNANPDHWSDIQSRGPPSLFI